MNIVEGSLTESNNKCIQSDGNNDQLYNLALHITSIFVILILSLFGASVSVVSVRVKFLRINPIIINTGKFFGSGVVLSTGFIHILPAAMKSLTDPCLPNSWKVYDASAGLFAMLAALVMQLIEYLVHQRYRSIRCHKTSIITNDNVIEEIEEKKQIQVPTSDVNNSSLPLQICNPSSHCHGISFQDDNETNKISTYLLEFGIALHSVLIGLALGTSTNKFLILFIALCFHQFFEGIALGAQIARLDCISLRSSIFMIIFFALTTPFGIAIGISLQSKAYNPKSVTPLLVNGILDSVSSGILIYVALVNLITAEMGCHAHAFNSLDNRLKFLYFIALYTGVGTMAIIGLWT